MTDQIEKELVFLGPMWKPLHWPGKPWLGCGRMNICRSYSETTKAFASNLPAHSYAQELVGEGMWSSIMGNGRFASKCYLPGKATSQPPAAGANGILGRFQGQYVTAATSLLPLAATSNDERLELDFDAGLAG